MPDPALLDRVRKALESVPKIVCHEPIDVPHECQQGDVDYHALTAKVAPLVEALERRDCHAPVPGLECPYCEPALAPWRTEGST